MSLPGDVAGTEHVGLMAITGRRRGGEALCQLTEPGWRVITLTASNRSLARIGRGRVRALRMCQTEWRHAYDWNAAPAAVMIHFGDRIPDNAI